MLPEFGVTFSDRVSSQGPTFAGGDPNFVRSTWADSSVKPGGEACGLAQLDLEVGVEVDRRLSRQPLVQRHTAYFARVVDQSPSVQSIAHVPVQPWLHLDI